MRKLYERLITAGGIAVLVAIFCYQVAYGTNESSYQWGYKSGREGYECSNYDADCDNGPSSSNIVKGYAFVNDVAPTIYQIANVTYPATYKGHPIHPLMGKSLVPLIEGKVGQVYASNEPLGAELFNQTAVRMGDWEAIHMPGNTSASIYPNGTDVWMLYNLANDVGEEKNVAAQHPDILKKMVAAYAEYAKNVGVVIPRGQTYANQEAGMLPPITAKNPVSINLKQIPGIPGVTTNATASYHNQTAPTAPYPQT